MISMTTQQFSQYGKIVTAAIGSANRLLALAKAAGLETTPTRRRRRRTTTATNGGAPKPAAKRKRKQRDAEPEDL